MSKRTKIELFPLFLSRYSLSAFMNKQEIELIIQWFNSNQGFSSFVAAMIIGFITLGRARKIFKMP